MPATEATAENIGRRVSGSGSNGNGAYKTLATASLSLLASLILIYVGLVRDMPTRRDYEKLERQTRSQSIEIGQIREGMVAIGVFLEIPNWKQTMQLPPRKMMEE